MEVPNPAPGVGPGSNLARGRLEPAPAVRGSNPPNESFFGEIDPVYRHIIFPTKLPLGGLLPRAAGAGSNLPRGRFELGGDENDEKTSSPEVENRGRTEAIWL